MTGAQPIKGAVRLLQVVDGVTRTAYGSRVQLTGVTRHKSITAQNAQTRFCRTSLVSFKPEAVLSKLNIRL